MAFKNKNIPEIKYFTFPLHTSTIIRFKYLCVAYLRFPIIWFIGL